MKPKLLIVELWGLGDLVIATPLLRAAAERFDITLLAKPYALDLQRRLWPDVRVEAFVAPWTAFKNKYRLRQWPWREIVRLRRQARRRNSFASRPFRALGPARPSAAEARRRPGPHRFPARGQPVFSDPAPARGPTRRRTATNPGAPWPARWTSNCRRAEKFPSPPLPAAKRILIHTGAGQPVRVWPLENYRRLAARLREKKIPVQIACDPDQRDWWLRAGENRRRHARHGDGVDCADRPRRGVHRQRFRPGPPRGVLRRADLHPLRPATAGVVRAAASGGGMDGRPGLPLHALLGLLPLSRRRTVCGTSARRKSGRAWKNSSPATPPRNHESFPAVESRAKAAKGAKAGGARQNQN